MLITSTATSPARATSACTARRGRLLDLHYHIVGDRLTFTSDAFLVDNDWLDIPFEAWKQWDYVQLLVRPTPGTPRAELVLSDLRGRYLRDGQGHSRPVVRTGTINQRLEFADCARGLSLQIGARAGSAVEIFKIFMGLTGHTSLPALGAPHLRPPPARLGA